MSVLNRMAIQIREWEGKNDPRSIFLSCYRMMTGNMLRAVEEGRFHDEEWVARLLHRFADYYFDALACYDCGGEETPEAWRYAYDVSRRKNLHVLQNLLLGINAHINYDLVLTIYDMLAPEWERLTEEQRRRRFQDHCTVNVIIAETIDRVQDEVVERHDPAMDWIDRAFGRLDERLLSLLISRWRGEVWEQAVGFLQCSCVADREACRRALEEEVLQRARQIALEF
jgi:hypothetical protein